MALTTKQVQILNQSSDYIPMLRKGQLLEADSFESLGDLIVAELVEATANAVATVPTAFGDSNLQWTKIAVGAGTSAEVDSGFDLPASALVHDVVVEVVTAEVTGATKTLDVGLLVGESGGDADGFLDGVSVAAVGLQRAGVVLNGGVYFDTTLRGVLLRHFVQGAGTDDRGLYAEFPHRTSSVTAKSVSYSRGATFVEFAGFIWISYTTLVG